MFPIDMWPSTVRWTLLSAFRYGLGYNIRGEDRYTGNGSLMPAGKSVQESEKVIWYHVKGSWVRLITHKLFETAAPVGPKNVKFRTEIKVHRAVRGCKCRCDLNSVKAPSFSMQCWVSYFLKSNSLSLKLLFQKSNVEIWVRM